MTSVTRGDSVTVYSQWYEYSGGPAAAVTGLTITITPAEGGTAVVGPTTTGVSNPSTGVYTYAWAVSGSQTVGDYLVTWTGTDSDSDTVTASEVVSVTAASTQALRSSLATLPDAIRLGYTLTAGAEESLLARATARIRRAAGQQISSMTSTVRCQVEDGTAILPGPPITAVASVARLAEDGGAAVTGWWWDGRERVHGISAWPLASTGFYPYGYGCRPADVDVTFTHGLVTIPDELLDLVCSVAVRLGSSGSSDATGMEAGIRSESIDDYSVTYASDVLDTASKLLPGEEAALREILGMPPSAYVVRPR